MNHQPMHYASGYQLDLYCRFYGAENSTHSHDEFPHTFTGETFAECARRARKKGWEIDRATRTATCPKCVKNNAR